MKIQNLLSLVTIKSYGGFMTILDFDFYRNYRTIITISPNKYATRLRYVRKRMSTKLSNLSRK